MNVGLLFVFYLSKWYVVLNDILVIYSSLNNLFRISDIVIVILC